ncbi:family 10 glycosylhydrolase [Gorillibacterium sp. sgz500922]|uniref:family 10 glycosylhydrolase n=1 Tax=Gorillibacterium sp. sgz500922 TaxID=3446694 RepID=UPI003F668E4D
MKIQARFFLLLALVLVWPFIGGSETQAAADIRLILDGKVLTTDVPPYLKPKVSVTMVPLRAISESFGARVDWSPAKKAATIRMDANTMVLAEGQKTALVNGVSIPLDASVEVVRGRTMVPIRFVSEKLLGIRVVWDARQNAVILTSGEKGNGGESPGEGAGTGGNPASPAGPTAPAPTPTTPTTPLPTLPAKPPVVSASEEMRGVWVSTVFNLDWPSSKSYGDIEKQKADYIRLLDDIQAMGMNAVFVQVRPSADAIYPSELVPWTSYLTGVAGKGPGYDPLRFMLDETHRRKMEFHAWFNPFRATVGAAPSLPVSHVVNRHPDWIVNYGGKLYINPGIPEARAHVIEAILEVVRGYDIDGVHLDDYFYPSGETASAPFGDNSTFRKYNNAGFADKGDWRRDNINQFVRDLSEGIKAVKPGLSFGISPYGVWRNKADDPTGSDTKASMTAYDSTYADVRTWIQEGWVDYVAPQLYWSMSRTIVRYDLLADWWANEVRGTGVKLYIGQAPYKLGTSETGWSNAQELMNQLAYNRGIPEIRGSLFFSAKDLRRNPLGLIPLLQVFYGENNPPIAY